MVLLSPRTSTYTDYAIDRGHKVFSSQKNTCPDWHNQPYVQWGSGLFPTVKHTGHGIDNSHPSGTEVKENIDLYLSSICAFMMC